MTELDKLMGRLKRLEDELVQNRYFLAKIDSSCLDEQTKGDATACINSKLDLINWIREQNEEIVADTQHDKERESKMGIWDKTIISVSLIATQLSNVLIMTSNLQTDAVLAARRTEALVLIDACNKFKSAMAKIDEEYTTEEQENDGNK